MTNIMGETVAICIEAYGDPVRKLIHVYSAEF